MMRDDLPEWQGEHLASGAVVLRGFARSQEALLLAAVNRIAAAAPFRHMVTPGGFRMSVAMTNCGRVGWVTDRSGYRYAALDPDTGRSWPTLPDEFQSLATNAAAAAGFPAFEADACLVNRYAPGARLSLHQDKDERSHDAPVVSISLGLPAIFLFGAAARSERPRRIRLVSGDVVVWGGPARLAFHGIGPIERGVHPAAGPYRFNLTLRRAF